MSTPITASMLYDLVHCPHRVFLDLFGDENEKDPTSPFVELLWERGTAYEREVIEGLELPFTNLRVAPAVERERLTEEAMARGDTLIYSGRITSGELLGEPDLLRKTGNGYNAGDIKSGSGDEGGSDIEEGRPKTHYAVQIALYTDILERKGLSSRRTPFVWDIHGREVPYALNERSGPRTPRTLWQMYTETRDEARAIVGKRRATRPALASMCKQCHWHTKCLRELKAADDITLIPELGRAAREALSSRISTVHGLASEELAGLIHGKSTVFRGVGPGRLEQFHRRAVLQTKTDPKPYLLQPVVLPSARIELFFDIETDPMREICYLHGFVVRQDGRTDTEQYVAFFADSPTPEAEEVAFGQAIAYMRSKMPCVVYFYSKYERTWWRALQERYPHVVGADEVDAWFADPVGVDLYGDVVKPHTIWPTHDHSIKTLASFLGFKWRDTDPSGAASIEWFDEWVTTGNPDVKKRILEYNEDDCRATRVLLDGIRQLRVERT